MRSEQTAFDPLWRHVLEPLRQRILEGDLGPGEPLSENRLAADYRVSRTPVREALRMLMDEGLVEMLPGRKLRVVVPQADDVREVYDIRRVLESEAVRRIVTDRTRRKAVAAALERCCDAGDAALAARDRRALAAANSAFHEQLIAALENRRLLAQFRTLYNLITLYRHQTLKSEAWAETGSVEHRALAKRLAAGDGDGALAILERHLEGARHVLGERLSAEHRPSAAA